VVTWPEAISRVAAGSPRDLDLKKSRFSVSPRRPVAVAGDAGVGKTQIWSLLTQNPGNYDMSVATDDGYMMRLNSRHRLALITIPGQISRPRAIAMDEIFDVRRRLSGVIYVASYGYDHVWPNEADQVASNLQRHDLERLRQYNLRQELSNFGDVTNSILKKYLQGPRELAPTWLLVLVNKLDLYWQNENNARQYYQPNSNSRFNTLAQNLVQRVGTLSLDYHVLPVATQPFGFDFQSYRGSITAPSHLSSDQCAASIRCLVDTLGELDAA
jgi:hypothetical protein